MKPPHWIASIATMTHWCVVLLHSATRVSCMMWCEQTAPGSAQTNAYMMRSARADRVACDDGGMKRVLVPLMIAASGAFMASAWLAHLRFKDRIGFATALLASWAIVLPEYALNVAATRYGYGTFTGAQMAAFHLCSGVVCVTLVSRFVLRESWEVRHLLGFALLAAGMWLLLRAG